MFWVVSTSIILLLAVPSGASKPFPRPAATLATSDGDGRSRSLLTYEAADALPNCQDASEDTCNRPHDCLFPLTCVKVLDAARQCFAQKCRLQRCSKASEGRPCNINQPAVVCQAQECKLLSCTMLDGTVFPEAVRSTVVTSCPAATHCDALAHVCLPSGDAKTVQCLDPYRPDPPLNVTETSQRPWKSGFLFAFANIAPHLFDNDCVSSPSSVHIIRLAKHGQLTSVRMHHTKQNFVQLVLKPVEVVKQYFDASSQQATYLDNSTYVLAHDKATGQHYISTFEMRVQPTNLLGLNQPTTCPPVPTVEHSKCLGQCTCYTNWNLENNCNNITAYTPQCYNPTQAVHDAGLGQYYFIRCPTLTSLYNHHFSNLSEAKDACSYRCDVSNNTLPYQAIDEDALDYNCSGQPPPPSNCPSVEQPPYNKENFTCTSQQPKQCTCWTLQQGTVCDNTTKYDTTCYNPTEIHRAADGRLFVNRCSRTHGIWKLTPFYNTTTDCSFTCDVDPTQFPDVINTTVCNGTSAPTRNSSVPAGHTRFVFINNCSYDVWLAAKNKVGNGTTTFDGNWTGGACAPGTQNCAHLAAAGGAASNGEDNVQMDVKRAAGLSFKLFFRTGCRTATLPVCDSSFISFEEHPDDHVACKPGTKNMAVIELKDNKPAFLDTLFSADRCSLADQCSNPNKSPITYRACETGSAYTFNGTHPDSDYENAFPADQGLPNTPTTLFEFGTEGNTDDIDLSLVSGYNVPMKRTTSATCGGGDGTSNTNVSCPFIPVDACPPELQQVSPFDNSQLTGACWDVSQVIDNPYAVARDSDTRLNPNATQTLLKYANIYANGTVKDPADILRVGKLLGAGYDLNDTREVWKLLQCWKNRLCTDGTSIDPCVFWDSGPVSSHGQDILLPARNTSTCSLSDLAFGCPPTQGIGCCAMYHWSNPGNLATRCQPIGYNGTDFREGLKQADGGRYNEANYPLCPGCDYGTWPLSSQNSSFLAWKFPAVKAGCYIAQYGERPVPPFDSLAGGFKPPLAKCPSEVEHVITLCPAEP